MIVLIPIAITVIYINVYFFLQAKIATAKHRLSLLLATIFFSVILILSTEIISLFSLINKWTIVIVWLLVIVSNICIYRLKFRNLPIKSCLPVISIVSKQTKVTAFVIGIILIITAITAIVSAPNNYDSLTYHLPRVMHWIKNENLENYPTHIIRQLTYPPGAELLILHVYILSGGDQLINLVQWMAFLGCIISVSVIIKLFDCSTKVQLTGMLITATLPMGILQATSTQNDLLASYYFICFICLIIYYHKKQRWWIFLMAVSSLGLAILTKAHIYLWSCGFVLLIGFYLLVIHKSKVWKQATVAVLVILLLNAGYFYRNVRLMGTPIGEGDISVKATTEVMGLSYMLISMVRNIAIHLSLPSTELTEYLNYSVNRGVKLCHQILGIYPKDSRIFYLGDNFMANSSWAQYEDISGNPIHVYLLILILAISIVKLKKINRMYVLYISCIIAGGLAFCFYLKWMVWHSRMHLPFFIAISPLIAISLHKFFKMHYVYIILTVLTIYSLLPLLINKNHMWLGKNNIFKTARNSQYMLNDEENSSIYQFRHYNGVIKAIQKTSKKNLGLYINHDTAEYPFWALLNKPAYSEINISHLQVTNYSKRINQKQKMSEIIVVERSLHIIEPLLAIHKNYKLIYSNHIFDLYEII